MGRFDALKENTFSSSDGTSRDTVERRHNDRSSNRSNNRSNDRNNNRNKANDKQKQNDQSNKGLVDNSNNHIMETKLENVIIKTEPPPPPCPPPSPPPQQAKESCWLKAIKKREEDDKKNADLINQADPKYWRGVNWIGPMLVRQKQFPNSWYPYVGVETDTSTKNQASSFIFPHGDTEYSLSLIHI